MSQLTRAEYIAKSVEKVLGEGEGAVGKKVRVRVRRSLRV